MVGHVMHRLHALMRILKKPLAWATPVGLALGGSWACAMGPADPFVPPLASRLAAQQAALGEAASAETGLSGVRLGKMTGAVVDGHWVRKGRAVRGARLVQVQRTRVLLKHPDGRMETIEMYPPAGGSAGASAPASTEAIQ